MFEQCSRNIQTELATELLTEYTDNNPVRAMSPQSCGEYFLSCWQLMAENRVTKAGPAPPDRPPGPPPGTGPPGPAPKIPQSGPRTGPPDRKSLGNSKKFKNSKAFDWCGNPALVIWSVPRLLWHPAAAACSGRWKGACTVQRRIRFRCVRVRGQRHGGALNGGRTGLP